MIVPEQIVAGDIFEIKLEKSYGYTYMKFIDVPTGKIQSGWAMMPLNIYSSQPIDINLLETYTPLFCNILGMGLIKFRGKYKQKIVGRVTEGLMWNPYATRHSRFSLSSPFDPNEKWWILTNDKHSTTQYLPYENVKHLALGFTTGITEWTTILTMIWIRRNGENIKDYYTEEEFNRDPWMQFQYDYAMGVVFYSELDPKYWNKPIE